MNADRQTTGMDIKVKLSMLWIFVLLNMIYADIISLMDAGSPIRRVMEGASMPPGGLLAGAVLMETSIAVVLLSQLLKRKANRWANIIVGVINIVAVIAGGQHPYYIFFATIEVVCISLIVWYAWKWPNPDV
jgi:sulfite exporter TauE/SafE